MDVKVKVNNCSVNGEECEWAGGEGVVERKFSTAETQSKKLNNEILKQVQDDRKEETQRH